MMDVCEQADTICAFYFITHTQHPQDGSGYWGNLDIENLLLHIHDRGHEIGLHTSYTSYEDPQQIAREFQLLLDTCDRLHIKQNKWGGRQHYLRWKAPVTWRGWDDAYLDYDTTLTYADMPGFRCGTCHPYRTFDVIQSKKLNLIEHPLIVMDCSVFSEKYQNLTDQQGEQLIRSYKNVCQKFNGEFGLLWHNSYFSKKTYKEIYQRSIVK